MKTVKISSTQSLSLREQKSRTMNTNKALSPVVGLAPGLPKSEPSSLKKKEKAQFMQAEVPIQR